MARGEQTRIVLVMPNSGNATFTTTALAGEIDAVLIVRNASIFTTRARHRWRRKKRERREKKKQHTHNK